MLQNHQVQQVQGGMILVIDDNPANYDSLSQQLKLQGYTVTNATNAQQALQPFAGSPYDLIMLDVTIPAINGLDLLKQLKHHDLFKHIPIIAISELEEIALAGVCIKLGAEDYVHKPLDTILLQARVVACLEKKQLRDREVLYLQQVERLTTAATQIETKTFNPDSLNDLSQQLERLTTAAAQIETKTFNPDSLDDLSQQPDKLGQLARVFQRMGRKVGSREQYLEQQVHLLQVSIDEGQKQRLVTEIAETDYFQQLRKRANGNGKIENMCCPSPDPGMFAAPPDTDRALSSTVGAQSPFPVNTTKIQSPTIGANSPISNTKIVAVHSFRGGTGKSSLISNLAVGMAKQGKRVAIIDTDLQSPGIHVLFGLEDEKIDRTLNDYLWDRCTMSDAAYDLSHLLPPQLSDTPEGSLYLIPASVKANDITRILREGYDQKMLLDGFSEIISDLQLDYLLIDTHPGINEETLQAIAVCSLLVVVLRPDHQDYLGTAAIVELARMLSVAELLLVVNKVLPSFDIEIYRHQLEAAYHVPVATVLPFSAKMMHLASREVFSLRYPAHPLSKAVDLIIHSIIDRGKIACPC
jgi:MinD-like ATPase involved in chromosome partitioning or flagellar assembly/DNA-binding response OmpR family regulator